MSLAFIDRYVICNLSSVIEGDFRLHPIALPSTGLRHSGRPADGTFPLGPSLCASSGVGTVFACHPETADLMLRPRKTIDPEATRTGLDDLGSTVRREAQSAEADPFDEAMVAAVLGAVEAMKAEVDALSEVEDLLGKFARKT